jgi:hypothetical protein
MLLFDAEDRLLDLEGQPVGREMPNSRHNGAIFSPSSSLAMKRSLSSIGLHSFQGIWDLPQIP